MDSVALLVGVEASTTVPVKATPKPSSHLAEKLGHFDLHALSNEDRGLALVGPVRVLANKCSKPQSSGLP